MSIPAPVPHDLDLRGFQYMPLDVVRLVDSDLVALSTGDEFKAAVTLWCKSWHQVPASSLPDDDRMLAHLAGYGKDVKGWMKVKAVALRHFVKASDGRLYHPVIAAKAVEAGEAKKKQREKTAAATEARARKQRQRDDGSKADRDVQRDEERDARRDDDGTNHITFTKLREGIEDSGSGGARDLLAELRKAAGWEQEPHPNLFVTGPIEALLQNGVDLDLDVLPTIRAIAPQAGSRTSWKYFLKAIVRARNDRLDAINSANDFSDRSPANGANRQKHSRARNFAILDAIIAEAERREDEAGGGSIENSAGRAA